jgi:translation initiation factor 5B
MKEIRQPIVTIAGHVDHGKTSILDKIRGTLIQEKEAGGITQKISFTELPKEMIMKRAGKILEKFKIPLEIPGFLFIDTPGHAAFTNLRKRGGNLADLAVLVIDINDGIKPQTAEVLQILEANKTPFIIALNKIDNISGWQSSTGDEKPFFENIEKQSINIRQEFDEKFYTIIGALNSHKIEAEFYTKIKDFTKKVAIIPCSAKTGEGISEILAILSALSQKFLKERIKVKDEGKGVILEVKKEKSTNYLEAILYDGKINIKDEIVIANFGEPIVSKLRTLQQALPLSKGYKFQEEIEAAAGLRFQSTSKEEILPGMQFQIVKNNLEKIKKEFKQELKQEIKTDKEGIIAKAESLGSLEALLTLLKQNNIQVIKANIGDITKKDIYQALISPEEHRAIAGFNVKLAEDVENSSPEIKQIKIFTNPVIYKIIEDFNDWKERKLIEIERKKMNELASLFKLTILPFVFRNTSPAIFGVKVNAGTLKKSAELISEEDKKIARVKTIQEDQNSIQEAESGKEVAISLPGVNFERQLKENQILYSNISETQFRKFKEHKNLLKQDEIKILQEIAEIKRKESPTWGI